MKVKDLIRQLQRYDASSEITLKYQDGRNFVVCKNVRAYLYDPKKENPGVVTIDGY